MKAGKTLVQLAQELERIKAASRDFVVPTEQLQAEVNDQGAVGLTFTNGAKHSFDLNNWSGSQVASYADIPKAYFDRIKAENPGLLVNNINHGLGQQVAHAKTERKTEHRMVRTVDGRVRAMLSPRYRILDAHDMLEAVLPSMIENGLEVISSEITEQKLYIKALSPRLKGEVKKGDTVQSGIVVSTSDVGAGSVRVEPFDFRLICLNGMISNHAMRKFHIGKNQAENDIRELLTDRTRELSDAAFWSQVRDVVMGSLKPENFEKRLDILRMAANDEIKNFDLPRVVELTMQATKIAGEGKKNSILAALASGNEGAGLTRWGLINAFTRAAQDEALDYEQSIEMERAGGLILELPKNAWREISASA